MRPSMTTVRTGGPVYGIETGPMTAATWGCCPAPRRPGELLTRGDACHPHADRAGADRCGRRRPLGGSPQVRGRPSSSRLRRSSTKIVVGGQPGVRPGTLRDANPGRHVDVGAPGLGPPSSPAPPRPTRAVRDDLSPPSDGQAIPACPGQADPHGGCDQRAVPAPTATGWSDSCRAGAHRMMRVRSSGCTSRPGS